ncbi:PREDICTED: beta-lactamase domain-containing protein 2-like isoform X1 [Priapulus caudatus]|uniref:Beta-lactamase domain-containing protein 2-like isoform X1 n=1 Tax=Priapulus caudatus TaxID=37621 RepID=A0ABM1E8S0_PRICU|nr:PREDICTED: beta-lactamase domain-containing protein 2-like isoform X1 [Priapulus caudatus]
MALTQPMNIAGNVAPGFELVRERFKENFDCGLEENGAAFSAYHEGKLVVDLRGGYADKSCGYVWRDDTLAVVFSTTKGVCALCIAIMVDRGLLKYDDPVVAHWPEFGQHGKDAVTVEMLVAHQAGVPLVDADLDLDTLRDRAKVGEILAREKPRWPVGAGHGYHMFTHGLLVDQLLRRVDPHGRTVGQFFAEEVAGPFGIDFHIGLARPLQHRVARIVSIEPTLSDKVTEYKTWINALTSPASRTRIFKEFLSRPNPPLFAFVGNEIFNNPDYREVEFPAANGVGTATALAKLYGILANGGSHEGHVLLSPETLATVQRQVTSGEDKVVGYLASKFQPQFTAGGFYTGAPYCRSEGDVVIGSPGYGGQAAFADAARKLGWAYITNSVKPRDVDERSMSLMEATYQCLDELCR